MKILIATGIFIPEIGGPATYVLNLAKELTKLGHKVQIVTYSDRLFDDLDRGFDFIVSRVVRRDGSFGKFLNYINYYQKLKKITTQENFDLIYAFDHFSAGLPASFLVKKIKKPFVIRVGGDFIWERYLSYTNTKDCLTLREFYQQKLHLKFEIIRFFIIKKVFSQATRIIFSTKFQRDIFIEPYALDRDKIIIINNPINDDIQKCENRNVKKEIVFYGRLNQKSNLNVLLDAFDMMRDKEFELLLIGNGEMKQNILARNLPRVTILEAMSAQELYARLQSAYLTIFPSLTDISPNGLLESLALGVPFVSTQEIGFEWLKGTSKMFDPKSREELVQILDELSDEKNYQDYQKKIREIRYTWNYKQLANYTVDVLRKIL